MIKSKIKKTEVQKSRNPKIANSKTKKTRIPEIKKYLQHIEQHQEITKSKHQNKILKSKSTEIQTSKHSQIKKTRNPKIQNSKDLKIKNTCFVLVWVMVLVLETNIPILDPKTIVTFVDIFNKDSVLM